MSSKSSTSFLKFSDILDAQLDNSLPYPALKSLLRALKHSCATYSNSNSSSVTKFSTLSQTQPVQNDPNFHNASQQKQLETDPMHIIQGFNGDSAHSNKLTTETETTTPPLQKSTQINPAHHHSAHHHSAHHHDSREEQRKQNCTSTLSLPHNEFCSRNAGRMKTRLSHCSSIVNGEAGYVTSASEREIPAKAIITKRISRKTRRRGGQVSNRSSKREDESQSKENRNIHPTGKQKPID